MTVEKISDYFKNESGSSLRRIFLAHQIQQGIKKELGEDVVVILTANQVKIKCKSSTQRAFLNNKKMTITNIVASQVPSKIRIIINT